MADRPFDRRRILVVEDEYLLADELTIQLADRGATVLGPASSVRAALSLIEAEGELDGAILDVNLGGEPAYPVADTLRERGVPVLFTTGYDAAALPERFQDVPRCEKPVNMVRIASALQKALAS
jgi:CheY-like chemotaxis protein